MENEEAIEVDNEDSIRLDWSIIEQWWEWADNCQEILNDLISDVHDEKLDISDEVYKKLREAQCDAEEISNWITEIYAEVEREKEERTIGWD